MTTPKMLTFFFFIFITSGISESHYLRTNGILLRPGLYSPKPKNLDGTADNQNYANENPNCICSNYNLPSVTEVLKNNGKNDLKRLVVYLYKDSDSNTVHLYSPNKDKQGQFPDLGLEAGDDLTEVGSETLNQVIDTNRNTVDVQRPQNPASEDGAVADDLANTDNADNADNQSTNKEAYQLDVAPTTPELDNDDLDNEETSQANHNYDNSATKTTAESFKFRDKTDDSSNLHNSDISPSSTLKDDGDAISSESTWQTLGGVPQKGQSSSEQSLNLEQSSSDSQIPYMMESTKQENPTDAQPHNDDSKNSSDQEKYQESESESSSHLPTIAVEDYLSTINKGSVNANQDQSTNKESQYVTFDAWFAQQMQKLHKTGQPPNKNVNLSAFKQLIEKLLYENGLYVTRDGVLTDSKANALNVTNLNLRPILIGQSVAYNNVFSQNKDKYEIPSNLPYLDSVLVSSVNPYKILGVIPLGRSFVPRVSYRSGIDFWTWRATKNNLAKCTNWQCKLAKLRLLRYVQSQRADQEKNSNRFGKEYKTNSLFKSPDNSKTKQRSVNSLNDIQYRFNLNKIFETFQSLFGKTGNPNNRKADFQRKARPDLTKPIAVVIEEEPEEEYEELPGFRIIGGLPATSSGTPVSSKGRSGRLYDY